MNDRDIIERYDIEVKEGADWYEGDVIIMTKESMIKLLQDSYGLKTITMPYRYIEWFKAMLEMEITMEVTDD